MYTPGTRQDFRSFRNPDPEFESDAMEKPTLDFAEAKKCAGSGMDLTNFLMGAQGCRDCVGERTEQDKQHRLQSSITRRECENKLFRVRAGQHLSVIRSDNHTPLSQRGPGSQDLLHCWAPSSISARNRASFWGNAHLPQNVVAA